MRLGLNNSISGKYNQLFFAGIDCLADIWLNGKHIGKAENMMIEHAFDVTKEIKAGESNQLQVILRSSVIEGQKHLCSLLRRMVLPSWER